MNKYEAIASDVEWVMNYFGSDAGERKVPGSKLKSQAKRIAAFVEQYDLAEAIMSQHSELDLLRIDILPYHK